LKDAQLEIAWHLPSVLALALIAACSQDKHGTDTDSSAALPDVVIGAADSQPSDAAPDATGAETATAGDDAVTPSPVPPCGPPQAPPPRPPEGLVLTDCAPVGSPPGKPSTCCIPGLGSASADHTDALQTCLGLAAAATPAVAVFIPAQTTLTVYGPLFLHGGASLVGQQRDNSVVELGGGCFGAEFDPGGALAGFQRNWINLGHKGQGKELLCNDPTGPGCSQSRWTGRIENLTLRMTRFSEPNVESLLHLHYAQNYTLQDIVFDQRPRGALANNTIGATSTSNLWVKLAKFDYRRRQVIGGAIRRNVILAAGTGALIDVMPKAVHMKPDTPCAETCDGCEQSCFAAWTELYKACTDPKQAGKYVPHAQPHDFCPPPPKGGGSAIEGCRLRRNLGGAGGLNVNHFSGGCDGFGDALGGTPCAVDSDCGLGGTCYETWRIEDNWIDGISDDGVSVKGSRGGVIRGNTVRSTRGQIDATGLTDFGSRHVLFQGNLVERIRGVLDDRRAIGTAPNFFHATAESGRSGVSEQLTFECNVAWMPAKAGRSRPTYASARGRLMSFSHVQGLIVQDNVFVDDTKADAECMLAIQRPGVPYKGFEGCHPGGALVGCQSDGQCQQACGHAEAFCALERRCAATGKACQHAADCATSDVCILDPAVQLWAKAWADIASWPGLHARCSGRCKPLNNFISCNPADDGCPNMAKGTACGDYREACTNKANDDPNKPIYTCLANLFGRGGGEGGAEFGLCDGALLASMPQGTAVRVEGNVLIGAAVTAADPLVTKISDSDAWPMAGDSLQQQLATLEAAKTGVFIDADKILSSISAAGSAALSSLDDASPKGANVAVAGHSYTQALTFWRARCAERGFSLARPVCH